MKDLWFFAGLAVIFTPFTAVIVGGLSSSRITLWVAISMLILWTAGMFMLVIGVLEMPK